jgi:RHS repeat-associated protein
VKVKLNSPAARVIAPVLVVLQVGLLPANAAAPVAGAVATSTPIAAPRVEVNRSAPALSAQPSEPSFSADPSDAEIVRARVFDEPFVPLAGERQGSENVDLARVIRDQARSSNPEDITRFEVFLRDHPSSRWSGAVLLGVGIVYGQTGYLTRALDRFERAWTLLEKETEPRAKALGDRALAELAGLNARLGRAERLEALFAAVRKRDVRGPAAEKFAATENVVAAARLEVRRAFRCGPMALERALSTGTLTAATRQRIFKEGSTEKGTSLSQLLRLSQEIDVPMEMAWREPGAEVITPAVVHWKSGHFAAITADDGRRSLVDDPVFGGQMSVSRPALDEEASGAFLVPVGQMPNGWRPLSGAEGDLFWGRGLTAGPDGKVYGSCAKSSGGGSCSSGHCPMADYKVNLLLVNLHVSDSPVGYDPPVGPSMRFPLAYNQREYFQPQIPSYSSFGPKWTFGWFSYVEDTPNDPNQSPNVYLTLGGVETYLNYNAGTQTYGMHYSSRAVLARTSSTTYERRLPDGSVEVFAQPDGSTVYPRRVFLTAIRDPQGNQVSFGYTYNVPTGALLLSSATDKIGQVTTFQYGGSDPRKITRVTDPFGRYASFEYDPTGRLSRITDVIGITSEFTYGTNDFISSLTTPYGTTTFQTGMSGTDRWLEATDPLGAKERFEYVGGTTGIPSTESVVPSATGLATTNAFIHARNAFYWDKRAMASMPYSIDYRKARITHWLHSYFNNSESSGTVESEKAPLENRVWYNYPGNQGAPAYEGTSTKPTIVARVLDDGTTQIYRYEYNAIGRVTKATDPVGRETVYVYGISNTADPDPTTGTGTNLLQVKQRNGASYDLLASYTYNSQHEPLTVTDASGQTTTFTYNTVGQPLTITNPKSETTTLAYDSNGYFQSVTGPVSGSTLTLTYDGFGRSRTVSYDGRTATMDYDVLDRPTKVTYPDGTYEQTIYNRLNPEQHRDRLGRWIHTFYDALGRMVSTKDAQGRSVTQEWCHCGSLEKVVDGSGNSTRWEHDLEGRVTRQVRADGTASVIAYENTTSRLKQVTDPRNQVTSYQYFLDGALKQIDYTNTVVATAGMSFTYDTVYPRLLTRTDGTGTTTYAYNPVTTPPALGAGRLVSVDGPLTNDLISYTYDEVGRTVGQAINGVASSWTLDALGRMATTTNPLGTFTYNYAGITARVASVDYPNGQSTAYSYFSALEADRLQQILHKRPGGSTLSANTYTYAPNGNILTWSQQKDSSAPTAYALAYDRGDQLTSATLQTTDATPVTLKRFRYAYDNAGNRTSAQIDDVGTAAAFNNLNQLTSEQPGGALLFKGTTSEPATVTVQSKPAAVTASNEFEGGAQVGSPTTDVAVIATDASGNARTNTYRVSQSGSSKSLTYDANGNLTGDGTRTYEWDGLDRLTAVNQGTSRSEFSYDGLGHRVRIVEKTSGTVTTDRRFLWCGNAICEERDASGATVAKRFFGNGVQQGGSNYFYTHDHLGSLREVTDTAGSVRARYDYDPYGRRTKTAGDIDADFGFTGHFVHAASGLTLTLYRAYDSEAGRWLSSDPIGIAGGLNLYGYAGNNPINFIDPLGLWTWKCVALAFGKGLLVGAGVAVGVAALVAAGVPAVVVVGVGVGLGAVGLVDLGWKLEDGRASANDLAFAAGALVGGLAAGWALGAAGTAAESAVSRGGPGPVLEGQAGVARAIGELEDAGATVLGREITLEAGAVRTRPDLLVRTADGDLAFVEVKNGPSAALTRNQAAGFPVIEMGGAIPRGANAAAAGLPVGQPLPPTPVWVFYY